MPPAQQRVRSTIIFTVSGLILTAGVLAAEQSSAPSLESSGSAAEKAQASSPASRYAVAYDSTIMADWLKKEGMNEEAIGLYTEAQNLFQKLANDYPLWETNVVAFRIKYCHDELTKLQTGTAAPMPSGTSVPSQASSTRPDESRLLESLRAALQRERASDVQNALAAYLAVLAEQPQNKEAIKGAGRCYLRLGSLDNARRTLLKGIDIPNPDAELNLLMALAYCYDKEYYKAYQLLLVCLNENPNHATAHLVMGVALAGTGRMEEARVATQKALSLNPKLGDAYYNLARISLKIKPSNLGIARMHYNNALRYGAAADPALEKLLP